MPEFIKRNYTDSIKVFTSKDLHYSGEQKANLKDKYMSTIASQELFALTPILEERMSEENHYSLNPRRRSKAGISQSNVVSNITSKEHSLVKSNFIPEKETWGTPGSIREVSHLDEVKSVESEREASTKIEDVRDSITDGVRDSVPSEPVVIVRPELNIVKKDLTIRHKKAISMVEHPSERKKSPKVMVDSALMSLRGSNLGDRPNLKKVQIGKAIGNLKVGTSEVWGQVFEKRKEKIPISHTKNASLGSAIPSLKIQTSPSKKSTKEEKKKIGSKTTTGVKTVESMGDTHRRTTSDFNYCTKSSQNLLNSARVAGKLFKANKTIDSKFEWKQGSPAKTLGSIKSDSSTSFSKKFAPTFADAKKKSEPLQTAKNQVSSKKELPKVIIEEQLKGLKKENLILKQENLNIKKVDRF